MALITKGQNEIKKTETRFSKEFNHWISDSNINEIVRRNRIKDQSLVAQELFRVALGDFMNHLRNNDQPKAKEQRIQLQLLFEEHKKLVQRTHEVGRDWQQKEKISWGKKPHRATHSMECGVDRIIINNYRFVICLFPKGLNKRPRSQFHQSLIECKVLGTKKG